MKTLHNPKSLFRNGAIGLAMAGLLFSCDSDTEEIEANTRWEALSSFSIDENSPQGTIAGSVSAVDDLSSNEVIYSIIGGNDQGVFEINSASGEILVADSEKLNYEKLLLSEATTSSLRLQAVVNGTAIEGDINITVNDLPNEERYVEEVFTSTPTSFRLQYGNDAEYNVLDFYEPAGDTEDARPLVILAGGGSLGEPTHVNLVKNILRNLAKRGYAAAYIYYRQANDGGGIHCNYTCFPTFQEVSDAFVDNVWDQKAAIRYFRKNAEQWRIDTDNIFIGGWAAGGNISLYSGFPNVTEDIPDTGNSDEINQFLLNSINRDPNGLEGSQGNEGFSSEVRGVIAMMTTIVSLEMIDANDPSLLLVNHIDAHTASNGCTAKPTGDDLRLKTTRPSDGWADGNPFVDYGTDALYNRALDQGYVEGEDLGYILLDSYGNCPNKRILEEVSHYQLAEFMWRNLTAE